MNTPHNTNPTILKQMLDSMSGTDSGGGAKTVRVSVINEDGMFVAYWDADGNAVELEESRTIDALHGAVIVGLTLTSWSEATGEYLELGNGPTNIYMFLSDGGILEIVEEGVGGGGVGGE